MAVENMVRESKEKPEMRVSYKLSLIAAVLGICCLALDDKQKAEEKKQSDKDKKELQSQNAALQSGMTDLKIQNDGLRLAIDQNFQTFAQAIVSNPAPTAAVSFLAQKQAKFEILNADHVDLSNWQSEYRNRKALGAAQQKAQQQESAKRSVQQKEEEDKRIASECNPFFDFTVTKLKSIVTDLANQHGHTAISNYREMPGTFPSNDTKVASIFLTNFPWRFEATVNREGRMRFDEASPQLNIAADGTGCALTIGFPRIGNPRMRRFLSTQVIVPGDPTISDRCPITNYAATVTTALRYFVAAHSEKVPLTNRVANPR
jgi:hypothetical protein